MLLNLHTITVSGGEGRGADVDLDRVAAALQPRERKALLLSIQCVLQSSGALAVWVIRRRSTFVPFMSTYHDM